MGLQALLDKCWTVEDREKCILKLAQDTRSNVFSVRHEARKLLMAYTFGKPTETHEHTGRGGGPIETLVITPKLDADK
jgi:hypothetical protein